MNNNQNTLYQLQKNAVKMVFKRKSIADSFIKKQQSGNK